MSTGYEPADQPNIANVLLNQASAAPAITEGADAEVLVDYCSESDGGDDGYSLRQVGRCGQKRRQSHSFAVKNRVITRYDELLAAAIEAKLDVSDGSGPKSSAYDTIESELGVSQGNIVKWVKPVGEGGQWREKVADAIAKPGRKKKLRLGGGDKCKWPEMEKVLALTTIKRREQGFKVRTAWLLRKARQILKDLGGCSAELEFKGSRSWIKGFARRNRLSLRRGTNHKMKSAAARLPKLWRFHKGLRTLIHSGSPTANQWSRKYGRYPPKCRFNVDQVPLAFDMGAGVTWDVKGKKRCWIKKYMASIA